MTTKPKMSAATARQLVESYRATPERSQSSRIGAALLAGERLTVHDTVERFGCTRALMPQVLAIMRRAGVEIESEPGGPYGLQRYGVADAKPQPANGRRQRVEHESAGVTHPQLGAQLTVRAIVLDSDGELVMQLTNGTGRGAWSVKITGHVS